MFQETIATLYRVLMFSYLISETVDSKDPKNTVGILREGPRVIQVSSSVKSRGVVALSVLPAGADPGIVKGGALHHVKQGALLEGSGGMLPWKVLGLYIQFPAIWCNLGDARFCTMACIVQACV